jgi:phosphohistidine swiveling domain-containing protein
MAKMNFFKEHSSLADWYLKSDMPNSDFIIEEDGTKGIRLSLLKKLMELPVLETHYFDIEEILEDHQIFMDFKNLAGKSPFSIRATPNNLNESILRNRNFDIDYLVKWLLTQNVALSEYSIEFSPHKTNNWSTIFTISENGIIGEAIKGGLNQLTQGFSAEKENKPIFFKYDFEGWEFSKRDETINTLIKYTVNYLFIESKNTQIKLNKIINCTFHKNYLNGYFEAVITKDLSVWFIDYNRVLTNQIDLPIIPSTVGDDYLVKGQTGSKGIKVGRVVIVLENEIDSVKFQEGDILVTKNTSTKFISLIKRAGAIVTDMGGILSHAAIICRELNIPCIVGTEDSTYKLNTGDIVLVNASNGIVTLKQ